MLHRPLKLANPINLRSDEKSSDIELSRIKMTRSNPEKKALNPQWLEKYNLIAERREV